MTDLEDAGVNAPVTEERVRRTAQELELDERDARELLESIPPALPCVTEIDYPEQPPQADPDRG